MCVSTCALSKCRYPWVREEGTGDPRAETNAHNCKATFPACSYTLLPPATLSSLVLPFPHAGLGDRIQVLVLAASTFNYKALSLAPANVYEAFTV